MQDIYLVIWKNSMEAEVKTKKVIEISPMPTKDIKNGLRVKLAEDYDESRTDILMADIERGQTIYAFPNEKERNGLDVVDVFINNSPE